AALDWLQDNRPSDADLQKQVLLSWVKVDLNDALPLVEDFARRTGQTDVYNTMVGFWVRQDPDKAIAWADSLDDSQKSSVYRTLAYNYIQSHPRAGLNWVVGLGAQYDDIKMSALRSINGENASVAQQILSNTSDPVARSALFMGLAQYKASRDPKAALNWLSGYQSSQHYPDAYITIMSRYAARDPTDAAQQLLDAPLPDEATRKAAFAIASTWYQQDAGAATRWVASLPTSAAGVGAIQGIATLLANKDPERALSLVASLPESDRSNVARSVGFIVVGKNPAEAEDVITRLGLGPMAAEQIRQLARSQKADTPNM
ncbi:MAG TPA: hypothetical protein VJ998_08240, partial [Pseudomonadales bacterium]|nr:hypothetical protein [Pseudomonadales bacterium]